MLHRIDHTRITEATMWFLVNSDYTSEEDIRRGVSTLISWIASSIITNLQQWIIGILSGLCVRTMCVCVPNRSDLTHICVLCRN